MSKLRMTNEFYRLKALKFKSYFKQMSARIYENNPDRLKFLLDNFAHFDINIKNNRTGKSLLHIAVQC